MRFALSLFALLFALFSSPAWSADYVVGEGDVLDIRVFEEDDLNRTVRVAADGSITFPLVGKVKVGGLSTSQITDALTEALKKDYLVNPQVTVHVQEYRSQKVEVLGAVKEPGVFYLTGPSDLIYVLAQAGGVEEGAGKFLLLSRGSDSGTQKASEPVRVDLHALLEGGRTDLNQPIRGGDKVFIPRGNEIYVMGEVNKQGAVPYEENLSLLQAISKAGGFTSSASTTRVQIIRVVDGKEQVLRVDVKRIQEGKERDITLTAEDIVTVPKSIF